MTTCPASCADDDLVRRVSANLETVRARIASTGRAIESVRVVAVTKAFGPEMVRAAKASGVDCVGENYLDELIAKRAATADVDVRWHFLGALQTNKISRVLAAADVVCTVSRAKEIDKIAAHTPGAHVYVQVDCTGAPGRNGAAAHDVASLVTHGRGQGLDVRGLMTVAPARVHDAREAFHITSELADELALVERSMGMSDDLEVACEYGTTEVRVGRALFGPRTAP
ncbi:MAG: alanine racemase [Acidimicrobiales bacterium]|jgi:uncharacterized pyridoxal phosphate-containing UPF0001 family protein